MIRFYDYIFYRLCMAMRLREDDTTNTYAFGLMGVLTGLGLSSALCVVSHGFLLLFGADDGVIGNVGGATLVVGGFLGIVVSWCILIYRFDTKKGQKRFKSLCKQWQDEPVVRRRWRGWAILLSFPLSAAAWLYCSIVLTP